MTHELFPLKWWQIFPNRLLHQRRNRGRASESGEREVYICPTPLPETPILCVCVYVRFGEQRGHVLATRHALVPPIWALIICHFCLQSTSPYQVRANNCDPTPRKQPHMSLSTALSTRVLPVIRHPPTNPWHFSMIMIIALLLKEPL